MVIEKMELCPFESPFFIFLYMDRIARASFHASGLRLIKYFLIANIRMRKIFDISN